MFDDSVSLLRWVTIVVVGTFANSLVFVSGLAMFDLIKDTDLPDALFRFWIGDAVGIFVAFPLLWWLQDFRRRTVFLATIASWESAGYIALSLVALWLAFVPNEAGQARYLYIVYLPLVWAAARHGVIGAVFCASLLQVGLLVAGWLWSGEGITAFELQMRSLLLAGVGFLIGVTVDERRRSEVELRQSLRLAAAGEMAAALAHELNQPLTALSAYGSAVERIIDRDGVSGQLRDVAVRMVSEAHRAADILHRLRDFFRTGATRLEVFPLDEVINTAIAPFAEKAQQQQIALLLGTIPSLQLHADRLQIEVVLRNLLSNAFDAVELQDSGSRRVSVDVACIGSDQIRIQVSDSGPGIDAALVERAFEPFVSSKSSGLGLGLAISRAIAEAHGGKLVASTGKGAEFSLFLPIKAIKVREHGRHRLHR
jgi:signal transduction histidine kinase